MSRNLAIKVENLSKRYRIGLKEEQPDTLVEALTGWAKRPLHNLRRLRRLTAFGEDRRESEDVIWALKDVSFEVERGEVVGVIGRNGAGKTTLLKILSRITHPTSGRVELYGRVSSLLEVGTGFHPELTGRENIYLNGTILGMTKAEIDRKFGEIVAFSGVEKFIDTPVKRFSSGMRVRLAFSVAAHLEPEILLVDEVLAVGDAEFQKKCLGKMDEVAESGRTVVYVSHNLNAIYNLASHCFLLSEGNIVKQGDPRFVINFYLRPTSFEKRDLGPYRQDELIRDVQIKKIEVNGKVPPIPIDFSSPLEILITISSKKYFRDSCTTIIFRDELGHNVSAICSVDNRTEMSIFPGVTIISLKIDKIIFSPGNYFLDIGINPDFDSPAWDIIRNYPMGKVFINSEGAQQSKISSKRTWGLVHLENVLWGIHASEISKY